MSFLTWFLNLFRKAPVVKPKPVNTPSVPLTLPHPEEPPTSNPDGKGAFAAWLALWDVSDKYVDYWNQIDVEVTENLVNSGAWAEMDSENNVLRIKPFACNRNLKRIIYKDGVLF